MTKCKVIRHEDFPLMENVLTFKKQRVHVLSMHVKLTLRCLSLLNDRQLCVSSPSL